MKKAMKIVGIVLLAIVVVAAVAFADAKGDDVRRHRRPRIVLERVAAQKCFFVLHRRFLLSYLFHFDNITLLLTSQYFYENFLNFSL